jgi:RimJ/RimL family protein N-acetyltransferase
MMTGEHVTVRPTKPEDYERLYAWSLDLATWGAVTERAPVPTTFADYVETMDRDTRDPKDTLRWAVDVDGELVGRAIMYAFDPLARNAAVGVSLAPDQRGKGYGRDVLRVLVDFGFRHRNLHRIWLETLATNVAGLRAYAAAGFVEEGRLLEHAWVDGAYVDMVRMAVLRAGWTG